MAEVILVRGNHDRSSSPTIQRFDPNGYVIAGHLHPGIRLYGSGGQRERLPCFFIGREHTVLPAFGDFTGLADVEPAGGDSVYAIAGDQVMKVY